MGIYTEYPVLTWMAAMAAIVLSAWSLFAVDDFRIPNTLGTRNLVVLWAIACAGAGGVLASVRQFASEHSAFEAALGTLSICAGITLAIVIRCAHLRRFSDEWDIWVAQYVDAPDGRSRPGYAKWPVDQPVMGRNTASTTLSALRQQHPEYIVMATRVRRDGPRPQVLF